MEALDMSKIRGRSENDWELYLRIRDECSEARRNHNIRQDLLEQDIVKRFVKAIRNPTARKLSGTVRRCHDTSTS